MRSAALKTRQPHSNAPRRSCLKNTTPTCRGDLPGLKLDKGDAPEVQLSKLAKNRFGIGTPEQVVEALMDQHRIGVTHVAMRASWPGMDQADILASLELIGTEVLPEVRRRIASGE